MTPFLAAILSGQMRRIEEQSTLRDKNAAYLEKLLGEIKGFRFSGFLRIEKRLAIQTFPSRIWFISTLCLTCGNNPSGFQIGNQF